MGIANDDAIKQFQTLMEGADESLKKTFENMHQGFPTETFVRFLKARDWNVDKAHKMLIDSLNWRVQNEIDNILSKPILPCELYRKVRDSQLVGMSGYSKEGHPVIAIGVGHSTYDKASVHCYVQSHIQMNEYRDRVVLPRASVMFGRPISTCVKILDMTGLKLSALNQIKLLTVISTIDDLNYPEKTDTYYIVNAPYIFSACWKVYICGFILFLPRELMVPLDIPKAKPFCCWQVVKPLLQERTRKKIQVLQGCGRDELLKIMDYASLPHFCKKEGSGSSRHSRNGTLDNCFSLDHPFHQELYNYVKDQAHVTDAILLKQGSFHVAFPDPDPTDAKIAQTIESEFHRLEDQKDQNGLPRTLSKSLSGLDIKIN